MNHIQHNPSELHTGLKGAKYELLACAWLLEQGYEVFRNVALVGKGDLVIWKKGMIPVLVDVKSGGISKVKGILTLRYKNGEFSWLNYKNERIESPITKDN
jgi:hypothetical protein